MFLKMTQSLSLGVTPEQSWMFLRDPERLAALIPGVENVKKAPETDSRDERYIVHVVEKVGPFRLSLNMDVRVVEALEPSLLRAELSGTDGGGSNRITGRLSAELKRLEPSGTQLVFDTSVEVLGKLASLGAAPIRRRAADLFAKFAERVQEQFPETLREPSS